MKTKWMKRTWSAILTVVMLLLVLPMSVFAADLQKNAVGAFLLYTSDDLKAFADYVNGGNYDADAILMDNITYEGTASIGTADIARTDYDNGYTVSNIKGYSGVFDGNGYTITLPVNTYLFGAIDGATVKKLTVSGGNKAIVAYMASGTVLLCNNRSTISGWAYCGGIADIVGAETSTSVSDAVCVIRGCANYGNLNVNWNVGGIVGAARGKNVLIDNCANYGNFDLGTGRYVGGIVGKLADGATVSYCYDSSTRSRVFSGNYGIAYSSGSTISNSFYVNGGAQTGATQTSGLTDEVLNMLNQNTSGIKWNTDGKLSARWSITFNANGGTGNMAAQTVTAGETYTLPANDFKAPDGQHFKAWSIGGTEYQPDDSITVTADTTVTAVWEVGTFAIFVKTLTGEHIQLNVRTIDTISQVKSKILDLKEIPVGKQTLVFAGTTLEDDKTLIDYDIQKDSTIHLIVKHTVTFDANGGNGTIDSVIVTEGESYTLPECTFTAPTGHTFKAWSVGGAEKAVGDSITVTADTTVTAVWEHIYSALKYDANGHWYECVCGEKGQISAHSDISGKDHLCDICKKTISLCTDSNKDYLCDICQTPLDKPDYPITATETRGGDVIVPPTAEPGQTVTIRVIPNSGKEISEVTVTDENGNRIPVSDNGDRTYTFIQPDGRVTISVTFKDSANDDYWFWILAMLYNQKFDITATATDGGTITPAGVSKVKYNKDLTYTVTPDEGYAIADVIVDGESVGAVSVYTFDNVRKAHEITVIFTEIPWENPYSDVSESDWFYEDVKFVDENNLIIGTVENETFAPDLTAARAMIVTILWRMEGEPVLDYLMQFEDVPQDEWYTEAVRWAAANGIVLGYDGMFNPENPITREQLAAILHRYAAYKGVDNGAIFPMIPQYDYSEWAENDVIWADMNGLIDGIGNDMTDMTADASRAEVAAILRRFCERFAAE